jgi:hypothetical protein
MYLDSRLRFDFNEDIKDLSDNELKSLVEKNMVFGENGITVKRTEKYTFVNFNFSIPC